jgi:hypothetical protein
MLHALLVVLWTLVLIALVLAGLTTLLFTIELDGTPALLSVLVVVVFHPVGHCWLLSTTMSPRDHGRAPIERGVQRSYH